MLHLTRCVTSEIKYEYGQTMNKINAYKLITSLCTETSNSRWGQKKVKISNKWEQVLQCCDCNSHGSSDRIIMYWQEEGRVRRQCAVIGTSNRQQVIKARTQVMAENFFKYSHFPVIEILKQAENGE
jgi:hypothetical protein